MAGWVPFDASWWPIVADGLPRPWPREAVLFDLRWWADGERMGRRMRPGRPSLQARWGWSEWAARSTLRSESDWADPLASPAPLQRLSSDPPAPLQSTRDATPAIASDPPAPLQRSSSDPPAPLPTRVEDHPTPNTQHPTELQKERARPNRSLDCADAIARCAELAGAGPLAGASGVTGTTLRRICDARREGYSVADLELLWAWGDTAPEADLARQRSGVARWGWLLAAQRDDRIEASRAWDRAGRPTGATRSDQGGGHLRAFAEMLREAEAEEAAEQARNQPGRLYVVEG